MWRLDVSSEAELEIFEAALRYERECADLGLRFEAQVNRVFARLLEIITVLAVLPMHRHPDTWKRHRRLGEALLCWISRLMDRNRLEEALAARGESHGLRDAEIAEAQRRRKYA